VDGHLPADVTVSATAMPAMSASLTRGRSFAAPRPAVSPTSNGEAADGLRWHDDGAVSAVRSSLLAQAPLLPPTHTFTIHTAPTAPASAGNTTTTVAPTPGTVLMSGSDGVKRTLSAVTLRPAGAGAANPPALQSTRSAVAGSGVSGSGVAAHTTAPRHQPVTRQPSGEGGASGAARGLAARLEGMLRDIDATVAAMGGSDRAAGPDGSLSSRV